MSRSRIAVVSALAATAAALAPLTTTPAGAATGATASHGCLASVPEPGTTDPVQICYSLFKPAAASSRRPVPMIMHSHGWGGSRTQDPAAFGHWLEAGYGVLSFDQRGFGESGGKAHIENPDYEGQDVQKLVRLVSRLDWVRQDGPGDPRLGAIGGSYGGGYQFVGAFTNLMERGKPVFDALAPEITWFDLKQSLAPQEVVRTTWASALSAASLPSQALPEEVIAAIAEGVATGLWPKGQLAADMDAFFEKNGPAWHVANGRKLDIPVLFGQGATDNLFPLEQGLRNWQKAITPGARRESIFVGYNGGHALPGIFPLGVGVAGDPCSKKLGSESFSALSLRFMDEKLRGRDAGLRGFGRYHLATADGACTTVDSVAPDRSIPIGTVATPAAAGPPVAVEVAAGPIRVAGNSVLTGTMTAVGLNNRAFYALAVGTNPLDAKIIQNNMLPVNELLPVADEERRIELPAVAVDVPAGQKLFVVASAANDMFPLMGSRTPGAIVLQDASVRLPVVG